QAPLGVLVQADDTPVGEQMARVTDERKVGLRNESVDAVAQLLELGKLALGVCVRRLQLLQAVLAVDDGVGHGSMEREERKTSALTVANVENGLTHLRIVLERCEAALFESALCVGKNAGVLPVGRSVHAG